MNDDEALKCLEIAQNRFREGKIDAALKFAKKALALNPGLDEAADYVEFLNVQKHKAEKDAARNHAGPGSSAQPGGEGLRHRHGGEKPPPRQEPKDDSTAKRDYTPQQVESVQAVLKVKHDYYKCLGVERTCTEAELKKAYRKAALVFHPDKNGAPGSEEAFKLVSRAYEVLADENLRRRYDQTGVDPGSRQQMAGPGGGGAGFAGPTQFEGGLTPEELFNLFFGGAAGPGFTTFATGGPGFQFRVHRPGRQQQQYHHQGGNQGGVSWGPILPFLLLILFSLLSSLFSGGPSAPAFSFVRSPPHTVVRTTSSRGVQYFVDPSSFPYRNVRDRTEERKLRQFEHEVETQYARQLHYRCQHEMDRKRAAIQEARGLFSVDKVKLAAAQAMKLEACEELNTWH